MNLEQFVWDARSVAIVCNQWGDTGKGKLVDFFSEWTDFIVRGTGGANAGHTIQLGDRIYIFHLVPCGIIRDNEGKTNVIGSGVAFDSREVCEELRFLEENRLSYNGLRIAYNAKLVLPQHIVLDRTEDLRRGAEKIGTTGRGIGPAYTDHYARTGLIVNDILNVDVFRKKLEINLRDKLVLLANIDSEVIRKIMMHPHLENGAFYRSDEIFDLDAIVEVYRKYGERLRDFICDADELVREARAGRKRILLEGAQGHLLSIDYGTYPFVTSSDCSIPGLAKGCGLSEKEVDLVFGVVKAPYMTRVGGGPFPTELGGEESARWCSSHTREDEEKEYPDVSVNDENEFRQGIAIRRVGGEYGATTGRPRRTGWLDLPLLRYAIKTNGLNIVLTKLQVLDDAERIKICGSYVYNGQGYNLGNRTLRRGDILSEAIPLAEILEHCKPIYREFPGWKCQTADIEDYNKLPKQMRDIVEYIERETCARVRALSMGPKREQTILRAG